MVEVVVKTQWQGKVAIRGRYIQQALRSYEGIKIIHNGSSMTIPNKEIYSLIVAKSEQKLRDTFRKYPPDYLYYFNWKPNQKQEQLL